MVDIGSAEKAPVSRRPQSIQQEAGKRHQLPHWQIFRRKLAPSGRQIPANEERPQQTDDRRVPGEPSELSEYVRLGVSVSKRFF